MARKVFISSDMSIDERLIEVAEENPTAALLWPWILTSFDDWGRAEANPKRLKAKVFPMIETVTFETISEALQLYAKVGLIILYQVDGKEYMAIPPEKWFAYQTHIRSSKRETDGSRYPAPPSDDAHDSAQVRADARKCTPSPSLSLSLSESSGGGDNARAREDHTTETEVAATMDEDLADVVREFQACGYGTLHERIQEELVDLLDTYGKEWVIQALRVGMEQGRRTLAYVNGILQRWQARGGMTLGPPENGQTKTRQGGVNRGRDRPSDRERLEQEYAFWNELSL